MGVQDKQRELEELKAQVRRLESEITREHGAHPWQATEFYGAYYATTGFMLGIFAASISLLSNVIISLIAGFSPLELIQVYLTFPLGEQALLLTKQDAPLFAVSNNLILAFGCCLYLGTGMLLGSPVTYLIARFARKGTLSARLLVGVLASLAIWVINFYLILSWLQPLLFQGSWILDGKLLPWWMVAINHIVFGATIAVLFRFAEYEPYRNPAAEPSGAASAA